MFQETDFWRNKIMEPMFLAQTIRNDSQNHLERAFKKLELQKNYEM